MSINGFYTGYMSGVGGNGVALFVFRDGAIVGADMGGVQFDGQYTQNENGAYEGTVAVSVPPGVTVIQGVTAPPAGLRYEVPLSIPQDFVHSPYIEISTPLGAVNARLSKIRDL